MLVLILLIGALWVMYTAVSQGSKITQKHPCQSDTNAEVYRHKWVLRFGDGQSDGIQHYLVCKVCGKDPKEAGE